MTVAALLLSGVSGFALSRTPRAPRAIDFENAYRVPERGELGALEALAEHVRSTSGAAKPDSAASTTLTVAFLGSSPTHGYSIEDPSNTFSEAFEAAALRDGVPLRVFNFATRGQTLGDHYYLARALAGSVDVLVFQLTYTSLAPSGPGAGALRLPELPRRLGVRVGREEAAATGLTPTPPLDAEPILRRALTRCWPAVRQRDDFCDIFFGGPPERRLLKLAAPALPTVIRDDVLDVEGAPGVVPFDLLEPAEQAVAVGRFAEAEPPELKVDHSEVAMLSTIVAHLRSQGARAAFFMSPLNSEALGMYGVGDLGAYDRNTQLLGSIAGDAGYLFLDYGLSSGLGWQHFTDITHTTDEGGLLVGEMLWRDLQPALAKARTSQGKRGDL